MDDTTNPLLGKWTLPPFEPLRPEHAVPAMEATLREARETVARVAALDAPDFDALALPLEQATETVARVFSPISHLNAVRGTPDWREAHDRCLAQVTAFHTELAQNTALYAHFERLEASGTVTEPARQKLVRDNLRDFRLAGVHLPDAERRRVGEILERLSGLGARFENNVVEAADRWSHTIADEAALEGLPADLVAGAAERARRAGESGWRLGLDAPTYLTVMGHAADRALRRTFNRAWLTRASDRGDYPELDNGPVMDEILALRHELARALGYANYAELSLATKMAPGVDAVTDFLERLVDAARPAARRDRAELEQFARETDGLEALEPWDIRYYSEKLTEERFGLSEQSLRPWFEVSRVLEGLFDVARRLFGVTAVARDDVEVWHRDVAYFDLVGADGTPVAGFYLDPYARAQKRSGAWMDVCTSRIDRGFEQRHPIAYVTLNAAPAGAGRPALMTHDEVVTLFHEFGHGLHHMLTRVDLPSLSGIAGVEWDAVEMPSQLLENWCWERESLAGFARHFETGEPLPDELVDRLRESRRFLSGLALVRQLEFSLFDFHLHADYRPGAGPRVGETLEAVRAHVAVVDAPEWNRFAHGFGHIFGGGYAAGYYSYLWAEVLAADAFDVFYEHGVFDRASAERLKREFLAVGGTRPAMDSFKAFRGREPEIGPLLALHGIAA